MAVELDQLMRGGKWPTTNGSTESTRIDKVRVYVSAREADEPISYFAHCTVGDAAQNGVAFSGEMELEAKTLLSAMEEVDLRWPLQDETASRLSSLLKLRKALQATQAERQQASEKVNACIERERLFAHQILDHKEWLHEKGIDIPDPPPRPPVRQRHA